MALIISQELLWLLLKTAYLKFEDGGKVYFKCISEGKHTIPIHTIPYMEQSVNLSYHRPKLLSAETRPTFTFAPPYSLKMMPDILSLYLVHQLK